MIKRAIIFDLDGTLRDATHQIHESYNKTLKENNLPYEFSYDFVKSFMGLTPDETIKLAFSDVDYATGKYYFDLLIKGEIEYLSKNLGILYPRTIEVLTALSQKYSLFIVSNSEKGYIENFLNGYNIRSLFKGILCAGDTGLDKHENLKIIIKKYEIESCFYVGDTYKDYVECQKAGVDFVHATYGFGQIDEETKKISSLIELIDLAKEIFID